jgi:hypothetical protein
VQTSTGSDVGRKRFPRGRASTTTLVVVTLAALLFPVGALAGPAVGEAAPSFRLAGSDGATYTLEGVLAEHAGAVLAWFPRAFTPG